MSYHSLPLGKHAPESVNVVVEIPKGHHNKYEYDEELGVMKLDRVLHSPLFYPIDYGFVPETRAQDGDHVDMLVLNDSPVFPGCLVEVRPIGMLKMSDENGLDNKVLGVLARNPHHRSMTSLKDVEPHILDEIVHFFEQYKTLEHKRVVVKGWASRTHALRFITASHARFMKHG